MNVISLKEYAKNNNISYEAVRQQVVRYADALGDHVIRDGRQQFLDEDAVAFLDAKRQKNPVVVYQQSKDETIEQLRQEKENLLVKVAKLSDWKADNAMAIAEANYRQQLLEEGQKQIRALEAQNADLSAEKDKIDKEAREAIKKAQEQLNGLTEAYKKQEAILQNNLKRQKRIAEAAETYASELEKYINLPFFKRLKAKKPVLQTVPEPENVEPAPAEPEAQG